MRKAFGLVILNLSLVSLIFPMGFYSLKPKVRYMDILKKGLLPSNNETGGEELKLEDLPILVGVFITHGVRKAIFFMPRKRQRISALENSTLEGGFFVKEISKEGVVLVKNGKTYRLELFSEEARKTREKRKRIAYIPSKRPNFEGIKASTPRPEKKASPGKTPKSRVIPDTSKPSKKEISKKARSFIEILKRLSRKKGTSSGKPTSNPFLELLKGRR